MEDKEEEEEEEDDDDDEGWSLGVQGRELGASFSEARAEAITWEIPRSILLEGEGVKKEDVAGLVLRDQTCLLFKFKFFHFFYFNLFYLFWFLF